MRRSLRRTCVKLILEAIGASCIATAYEYLYRVIVSITSHILACVLVTLLGVS
jgi:hypothetical protein